MNSRFRYKFILFVVLSLLVLGFVAIIFSLLNNKNNNINGTADNIKDGNFVQFIIYGDSRTGTSKHKEIVEQILKRDAKAVFHTGDLVEDGRNENEWKEFLEITEKLREKVKMFPVYGNHERNVDKFTKIFELPKHFYKVNYKENKITFILLDSNLDLSKQSEQYIWLENELNIEDKTDNLVVVILHHPLFTVGMHDSSELAARDDLRELFKKHKVSIVFSGHNHTYERFFVDNTYYIVTGGGGAPLYDKVRNSQLLQKFSKSYNFVLLKIDNQTNTFFIEVYNEKGNIIDSLKSGF